MAVNKVIFGGETVVDLTSDSVTADKMLSGTTAHDKSGETIMGTIETFDGSYECSGESTGGGESGGGVVPTPVIQPLEVTQNGEYAPPTGVDGYAPVKVSVPIPDGYIQPSGTKEITENGSYDVTDKAVVVVVVPEREIVLQDKEITVNGKYSADDGYDGLGEVNVNVPIPDGYIKPSGELEVAENGVHDVTAYTSVNVNVPSEEPLLQEKTVTENGEVTPDAGYDGLSKVVVNVSAGGSGDTSIETCTVTLQNYLSTASGIPEDYYRMFHYVDSTLNTVSIILPFQEIVGWGDVEPTIHTFTVVKNTIISAPQGLTANAHEAFEGIRDRGGYAASGIVRGDCTISIG